MDLERALRIQNAGLRDFVRVVGSSSPGAHVFERDGVEAAIIPGAGIRSLPNSIVYADAGGLLGSLDALHDAYETAGVEAWLVWVPEHDDEAIRGLEAAGYVYDGSPAAMHASLADLGDLDPGDLDWDAGATPAELAAVNDAAYGIPPKTGFSQVLVSPPASGSLRLYRARAGGETASVMGTIDNGTDVGVYFVATGRGHRRGGLATRLIAAALAEARERGLETTSLQASAMGEPVYERMGYRTEFRFQLWEHRLPRPGSQ